MKISLSDYQLGWLVGILEGEGYFEYNGSSQKVTVRMTDEDTMAAVSDMVSKIVGRNVLPQEIDPINPRAQNIFEVRVCGAEARTVMKLVAPYMHYRRRRRIWQSLNKYKPPKQATLEQDTVEVKNVLALVRKSK